MTLPFERTRATPDVRLFLRELTDPALTPRVPRAMRVRAPSLLKPFRRMRTLSGRTMRCLTVSDQCRRFRHVPNLQRNWRPPPSCWQKSATRWRQAKEVIFLTTSPVAALQK